MLIIAHGPCSDGGLSAFLLSKIVDNVTVTYSIPVVSVNNILKFIYERELMLVDLCVPENSLLLLKNYFDKVYVIDHHKSNSFVEKYKDVLDLVVFDTTKCAARLVWETYFDRLKELDLFKNYTKEDPHWIVKYVEDRDLFNNALENTAEVVSFIRSFKPTVENFDYIVSNYTLDDAVRSGKDIERYREAIIKSSSNNYTVRQFIINNKSVVCAFTPISVGDIASDVLSSLLNEVVELSFGLNYDFSSNKTIVQVRASAYTDIDAADLAKTFGGGGHKKASGFVVNDILSLNELIEMMEKKLQLQEANV